MLTVNADNTFWPPPECRKVPLDVTCKPLRTSPAHRRERQYPHSIPTMMPSWRSSTRRPLWR